MELYFYLIKTTVDKTESAWHDLTEYWWKEEALCELSTPLGILAPYSESNWDREIWNSCRTTTRTMYIIEVRTGSPLPAEYSAERQIREDQPQKESDIDILSLCTPGCDL